MNNDKVLTLWPHQKSAIAAAHAAMDTGRSSGLWAMPTGTGKTIAFASFASALKLPALVMVHRDELVRQTVKAFGVVLAGCVRGRGQSRAERGFAGVE